MIEPDATTRPQAEMESGSGTDSARDLGETQPRPTFRVQDRRVGAQHDDDGQAAATDEQRYPSYVEELRAQKELAEKKLAEKIQWIDEEVARIRERLSREQDRKLEAEKRRIVQGFLEVADNFERAINAAQSNPDAQSALDGLKLIRATFLTKLHQLGVQVLDVQGQPFDPNVCEGVSVSEVESAEQDQLVLEVFEAGYRVGDQLLRPAKVRVGRYGG